MSTNRFLNNYTSQSQQQLYENLFVEAVKFAGHDMIYMPAEDLDGSFDFILNEQSILHFTKPLDCEFYIQSYDAFGGDGELMSKFSFEIRDRVNLILTERSFKEFIQPTTGQERPMEGDVIYIPMLNAIFSIVKVSKDNIQFYALGRNYAYELTCELLEWNNQIFNTGRPEVDGLFKRYGNIELDPNYSLEDYDATARNKVIQDESVLIIDLNEISGLGGEE